MKIFILGAGKVGRAIARALTKRGDSVTLRAARKGVPTTFIDADLLILSVRERQLGPIAADLAVTGVVKKSAVVVHNAGSLSAEALAPLRGACAGVAQMHPMISFASTTVFPTLTRGHCHVKGEVSSYVAAYEGVSNWARQTSVMSTFTKLIRRSCRATHFQPYAS
jgi:prephenate dehydrogenase